MAVSAIRSASATESQVVTEIVDSDIARMDSIRSSPYSGMVTLRYVCSPIRASYIVSIMTFKPEMVGVILGA